ncbi:hypothetical protein [Corynebacterium kozikiae]|nr:hypothetical protein [Corynebacterium sp. 76QC2CO]MCQ9342482.1 hypothetical protein [Corynebacterium sp. 76QC2CO]
MQYVDWSSILAADEDDVAVDMSAFMKQLFKVMKMERSIDAAVQQA